MTDDGSNDIAVRRRAVLEIGGVLPATAAQPAGPAYVPDQAQVTKWLARVVSDYQALGYSRAEILNGPAHDDVRLRIEALIRWAANLARQQAAGEAKELGKRAVVRVQNLKAQVEKERRDKEAGEWLQMARTHIQNQAFPQAREALEQVIRIKPNEKEVLRLGADAIAVAIGVRGPNEGKFLKFPVNMLKFSRKSF